MRTSPPRKQEVVDQIISSFRAHFDGVGFFKHWFMKLGTAYHFLFQKNLAVTNIQFAELLSLLVRYRKDPFKGSGRLQFLTVEEFDARITEALSTFIRDKRAPSRDEQEAAFTAIADRYWDLLANIAVVKPLYGSCAVYLPPGVTVQLNMICAQSGYIHSCGRSIFLRNVAKARMEDFFAGLDDYLERRHTEVSDTATRVFFVPYAHEDFSNYDRSNAPRLRHGLDEVKLYVHKFHMGPMTLVDIIKRMRRRYRSQMLIPAPGDFTQKHSHQQRHHEGAEVDRTLWLFIDRSTQSEPDHTRYYVCYEQLFVNENCFHVLDENKPAWVAHVTIPHTLMGAMINLALMYAPPGELRVADPFVGSGTAFLELSKHENVRPFVSDHSAGANQLTRDNLEFFSLDSVGLGSLISDLQHLAAHLRVGSASIPSRVLQSYLAVTKQLDGLPKEGDPLSPRILKWLKMQDLCTRVFFYTGLKAVVRHGGAIRRKTESPRDALAAELELLATEIQGLRNVIMRQAAGECRTQGGVCVYGGNYSLACGVSRKRLLQQVAVHCVDDKELVKRCDATVALKRNYYDLIVTDPPYGFNTDEDLHGLSTLYRNMIGHFLRALRDGGQLIIALPDASYIGRPFLFFTRSEMVVHQILVAARELGMDVLATGHTGSRPLVARPPYYWESERALRRSILHFRFRRRPHRT